MLFKKLGFVSSNRNESTRLVREQVVKAEGQG